MGRLDGASPSARAAVATLLGRRRRVAVSLGRGVAEPLCRCGKSDEIGALSFRFYQTVAFIPQAHRPAPPHRLLLHRPLARHVRQSVRLFPDLNRRTPADSSDCSTVQAHIKNNKVVVFSKSVSPSPGPD